MSNNKYQTFISYPRKNAEFALKLATELKNAGFQIWFDQLDIPAGSRWDDEVPKALAECEIFMVILTPEAIESQNVKDEIGNAIDSGKRIMPVLLQHCNIPFRLRRFHYVDFTMLDYDLGIETAEKLLTSFINETTIPRRPNIIPGSEFVLAADCGHKPASDLTCELFPLSYRTEPVGQIIVSRRTGEDSFTSDEKALLQNIARQVGVAAYAIQVTRDLQRSRERLVTAREEERRRLRRYLHDGLGPTLASLTLKLDAARNQLKRNPDTTDSLLVELKSQTHSAIEDIRRLVYNLRPPALDELGLFSATQEYATSHLRAGLVVRIEQNGELPNCPPPWKSQPIASSVKP